MRNSILRMTLCLLIFASCETPISLTLPEQAGTTVIEGWIENEKTATVAVSYSMSYYSTIDLNTIFDCVDTAATVIVTDDMGNSETLQLGFSWEHIFGIMGRVYVGQTIKGVPGHTYNLYVKTSNGHEYTAKTYIPANRVQVDSIYFPIKNSATDTALPLMLSIKDDFTTYDCYRFFSKISNLNVELPLFLQGLRYCYAPVGCLDDLTWNGKTLAYQLFRGSVINLPISGMSYEERKEFYRSLFRPGDTVIARSTLIDVDSYKYWFTVQLDMEGGGNPIMVPGHYKTNLVGNNVTGIWSGYHARYDTIVFPKVDK